MIKYMLLFMGLLCGKPTIAALVLTVDNPVQDVAPGESAVFYGSVVFDADMPFGAEPVLAPPVPATFSFSPALALAGPFGAGEIYSGPLLVIDVPHEAMAQVYSAMLRHC